MFTYKRTSERVTEEKKEKKIFDIRKTSDFKKLAPEAQKILEDLMDIDKVTIPLVDLLDIFNQPGFDDKLFKFMNIFRRQRSVL